MKETIGLKDVEKKIAKIVSCEDARVCSCGNEAIFSSLMISKFNGKTKVIIPDQGGWISYERYPKLLGLECIKIKTDYGLVNSEKLSKELSKDCVFILPVMAGYFALQNVETVYEACKKNSAFLILDVTATFPLKELCNYNAHIILGSFGEWKPLDLGYGGFIAFKSKALYKDCKDFFTTFKVPDEFIERLDEGLENSPEKIKILIEKAEEVKRELKDFEIIHKDKAGLNVVVKYASEKEKTDLISYCNKNSFEFVECPKNIKIEEKAISIELKRLQITTNK